MRILYVIDTHIHADHISAGRALAEAPAPNMCSSKAQGRLSVPRRQVTATCSSSATSTVTVMHTPGHTPEHISLLVTDRTRAAEPWFVLTGHTLMVGDLGRTELASSAEDGARALFRACAG